MLPHFLGIGAKRSGTSWLWKNLSQHPEVAVPPMKELHHFNHPSRRPYLTYALGHTGTGRRLRRQPLLRLVRNIRFNCWPHVRWLARYLVLPRGDRWYASLFSLGEGQRMAGEVTPNYAVLPEDRIRHIHHLMPDVRLIYILRNPVDRIWSDAAMTLLLSTGRPLAEQGEDAVWAFLSAASCHRHSNYLGALERWQRYFPAEQLHIGFFDELVEDPQGYFERVLAFLGLSNGAAGIPADVRVRRNERTYPAMPGSVQAYLAAAYHEKVRALHRRFQNRHTAKWLKEIEEVLGARARPPRRDGSAPRRMSA